MKNKKFGRLTVLEKTFKNKHGKYHWLVKCSCGNKKEVNGGDLRSGKVKSCGCLRIEEAKKHLKPQKNNKHNLKHGLALTRFWRIHRGMINRCNNKKMNNWEYYGGKGIKVCKRWLSFEFFKKDMLPSYTDHVKKFGKKNTTIDRINSNKNYCPSNCRWATRSEQRANQK